MARSLAVVNMAIWQDVDFRALPREAQHLYLVLWSDPSLSYCGVADWRPGRVSARAFGWSLDQVQEAADCLESRHLLITDADTEEVLIRSWIRFDGLMGHHIMSVSMAKAFAAVSSNDIRGVLVHELARLQAKEPDLAGWKKAKVLEVLDQPSLDPRSREVPADPFANRPPNPSPNGSANQPLNPSPNRSVKGKPTGEANQSLNPSPTPTPTPTPYSAQNPRIDDVDPIAPDRFDEFWFVYPKKASKKNAKTRWAAATKKTDPSVIIAAAKKYADHLKRTGKLDFCMNPDGWINQERFNDEIPDPPADPDAWMNDGRERPLADDDYGWANR